MSEIDFFYKALHRKIAEFEPKTNLDTWKDSLSSYEMGLFYQRCVDCTDCPLAEKCDHNKGECLDRISEWANAEAEEETK